MNLNYQLFLKESHARRDISSRTEHRCPSSRALADAPVARRSCEVPSTRRIDAPRKSARTWQTGTTTPSAALDGFVRNGSVRAEFAVATGRRCRHGGTFTEPDRRHRRQLCVEALRSQRILARRDFDEDL